MAERDDHSLIALIVRPWADAVARDQACALKHSHELVPPNVAMLTNVLDSIEPVASGHQHISLMQGYKVYGAHLGPLATPAREDDPPHMPPEFNVDQQRSLERRQVGIGNPMNLAMLIAVYASISKESGISLRSPGSPSAYSSLIEMTDADLLAKATVWAAPDTYHPNQAGEPDLESTSNPKRCSYGSSRTCAISA